VKKKRRKERVMESIQGHFTCGNHNMMGGEKKKGVPGKEDCATKKRDKSLGLFLSEQGRGRHLQGRRRSGGEALHVVGEEKIEGNKESNSNATPDGWDAGSERQENSGPR